MGESLTDAALNVFGISGVAWALTVHKAAEAFGQDPAAELAAYWRSSAARALVALDAGSVRLAEAELRRAKITDECGAIRKQWLLAVWISAFAPLKAAAVVQSAEESVHTELALASGRGVAVTYARRIRHGQGVEVTEVRNAVEISFFAEENAWAALNRHLPDTGDVPGSPHLPKPGLAAFSEGATNAGYTIHLEVAAHHAGSRPAPLSDVPAGAPDHVSKDVWVLAEHLYSFRTAGSGKDYALAPVPRGSVGQAFAWRLLGAREYLASVAEQAA